MATYNFNPGGIIELPFDVQEVFAGQVKDGPARVNFLVSSPEAELALKPYVGQEILEAKADPNGRINMSDILQYSHSVEVPFILDSVIVRATIG